MDFFGKVEDIIDGSCGYKLSTNMRGQEVNVKSKKKKKKEEK